MCEGDFVTIAKAQMDILILALACDLTRVANIQWSTAESTTVHTEINVSKEHHLMSHDDVTNAGGLAQVHTWYSHHFSLLLDRLAPITDPDGQPVRDASLVSLSTHLSN